jgi:hypothetical protein
LLRGSIAHEQHAPVPAPAPWTAWHLLADGTLVELAQHSISVERADGSALFRYDVEGAHGRVTLASESLTLAASAGDLALRAAGAIRFEGRSFSARASMPGHTSSLTFEPRRAQLRAESLELSGESFQLAAQETELYGGELRGRFTRARLSFERLETAAGEVVARARSVYQSVHELLEQQIGDLRTRVTGTAQLKAREIAQRAERAYKLRAEKIHLG